MGLARSDESAKRLEAVRAAVQCGDLEDSPALQRRPRNPLALSILRFSTTSHGAATFPQWGRLIVVQWRRWELRLPARTGHSCSLQAWWAWLCRVATEDDELVETAQMRPDPAGLRVATAPPALSLRGIGVRSCVVRLRPTVHGDGDHGFTCTIAEPARERRVAAYVGEGTIRWSPVHRADAARLARLALESAPAGSVLHAAAAAVAQLRHISEIMARHLEVPTPSVLPVEALEYFGHLATSSASTALGRRHPRPRRSTGDLPVRTCSRILRQSTAPNARAERCPHSPPRANGRRPARHRRSRRYGAPARGALPCTTRSRCPASAARQHRRDRAAGASQGRSRCSGV